MKDEVRIGQGFDVHKFGGSGPLLLGGVKIPFDKGLIAHSDGDVLLHSIIDALLGALALGDIGQLFPDCDVIYKNADSRILLKKIYEIIRIERYRLVNIDSTVITQTPRVQPYTSEIRANLAEDLQMSNQCVSVKATTTENLGFIGRQEGIACQTVLLLKRKRSGLLHLLGKCFC